MMTLKVYTLTLILIASIPNVIFENSAEAGPKLLHSPYGSRLMRVVNSTLDPATENGFHIGSAIERALAIPMNSKENIRKAVFKGIRDAKGVTSGELGINRTIHVLGNKIQSGHTMQRINSNKGSMVWEMRSMPHEGINKRVFDGKSLSYSKKGEGSKYIWSKSTLLTEADWNASNRLAVPGQTDNYFDSVARITGIPLKNAKDLVFTVNFRASVNYYAENNKAAARNSCSALTHEDAVIGGAPPELGFRPESLTPVATKHNRYEDLPLEEQKHYLHPDKVRTLLGDSWGAINLATVTGLVPNEWGFNTDLDIEKVNNYTDKAIADPNFVNGHKYSIPDIPAHSTAE